MKQLIEAFQSRKLEGIRLINSFLKTATFEGMYDFRIPSQKFIDHQIASLE